MMKGKRIGILLLIYFLVASGAGAQPYGLGPRVANSTLQMPTAIQVSGWTTTNAFANLILNTPFCVASPPGETNRLFILEKAGRIVVITNLANPTRTIFLDISDHVLADANEEGLLGMAFHPGYATNHNFYLFYTAAATTTNADHSLNTGLHDRLSAFKTSTSNANQGLNNSEIILIQQYDEDSAHQAGDLHFGPDGYLYVSLGDEGSGFDSYNNSQRIDKDFFSGILRIDVDKLAGNLKPHSHASSTTNYFVPKDNPFVRATNFNGVTLNTNNVHEEFWAVGLRNPWRFTFDPTNGRLFCADVGQETWEEINVITKGGNYGWAFNEGAHPGPKSGAAPPGFVSVDPILEYTHGTEAYEGDAVIGGVVYTSNHLPQLTGAYVFGDYIAGNIWMMFYNGTTVTQWQRLCIENFPSSFGIDPGNGDVLIVKHSENNIKRLIYLTNSICAPLPPMLDQTGAFNNLSTLTPNPGIIPYTVNAPFWSDNAEKTRWFCLPNPNLTIDFQPDGNWSFPTGTVWIKHFELPLTNGVPSSAKRIETRFLVRNSSGVYGVSYRWGNSTSNATLVPDEGMEEDFTIYDSGTPRTQTWHYPARNECLVCHNSVGGWALGFNTPQLNGNFNYGGTVDNQIRALNHAGYFSSNVTSINNLRALANLTNTAYSVDYRVHSYVAANCVHCHQPGGVALGYWDARIATPLSGAGIIDGGLQNNFYIDRNRVIAPGTPGDSVLLQRISTFDPIRMPPLGSRLINTQAINLITTWTYGLTNYQSFSVWQIQHFGSTNSAQSLANADPDHDGANNYLEYLTGTDPLNPNDAWKISIQKTPATAQIRFPQIANRGFEMQFTTNLFSPVNWQPVDTTENRQFFSATNFTAILNDSFTNNARYYRVRVLEP